MAEFILNAEQLVVFRDAVGARRRACFDLAGVGGDGDVGDRAVFRFAGAVRDDSRVAGAFRHFDGVKRFGERADLVHFDQNRVADAFFNAFGQFFRVRDEQVVADKLHFLPSRSVSSLWPSQSFSSSPSSIEMIGYFDTSSSYQATISSDVFTTPSPSR